MYCRKFLVAATLAALCLTFSGIPAEPSAPIRANYSLDEISTTSIAARWYRRARRGQLFQRSTPSGRYKSQTLRPGAVA